MIKYNPEKIDAWVRYAFPDCWGWAVYTDGEVFTFDSRPNEGEESWRGDLLDHIANVDLGDIDWKDTWHDIQGVV